MHFDGWNTLEGRHLVFAFAGVILLQAGYAGWIAWSWLRTSLPQRNEKAAKLD